MVDTASLQIKVESKGIDAANKKLGKLSKTSDSADRATSGLTKQMSALAGPVAAATTATAGLVAVTVAVVRHSAAQAKEMRNLARVAKEGFERFQGYAYATESAGVSSEKFADISKDLQDKLGDFIATGGGEFADFFENVGSKVGLTAQSLQKLSGPDALIAVKKAMDDANVSAEEQVFYLEAIASDASLLTPLLKDNGKALKEKAEQAKKLNGVLSEMDAKKLEDAAEASKQFDTALGGLTKRVSVELAPAVTEATELATEAFVDLTNMIASGEIAGYLDAIVGKFDGFGSDVASSLDMIQTIWNKFLGTPEGGGITHATGETVNFMIDAFKKMPENIRTTVQIMTIELASLVDYGSAYGKAFGQVVGVELARLADKAGIYGKEIRDKMQFWDGDTFDFEKAIANSNKVASDLTESYFAEAEKQARIAKKSRLDSIAAALKENKVATNSFETQIQQASKLRDEYQKLKNSKPKSGGGDDGGSVKIKGGSKSATKNTEFESLKASLRTEEEIIQESYDRRLAMILANTKAGSEEQADLKARLDKQFASDVLDGFTAEPESFSAKEAALQAEYERRRQIILENTKLTEEARTSLEEELAAARNERLATLEAQRTQFVLGASSQLFGELAGLSKTFAGEQSSAYQAMFAVSKAFSIAQSGMSIATGIAKAQELGFPANIAEMARVTAAGASILATIQGSNFSGAYDHGGMIPAGKYGIVGEYGPELVSGPANITSRRTTADSKNTATKPETHTSPQANIRIINAIDPSVMSEYLGSKQGEKVVMNIIKRNAKKLKGLG